MSTLGLIKSDTDLAVMDGMLNFSDIHSDSDDDIDLDWKVPTQKVKYSVSEQEELDNLLVGLENKMSKVKYNIKLIIQREALVAQSFSKVSRKRKRKKTQELQAHQLKKQLPN